MSDYLTPEEARERLERGEVLETVNGTTISVREGRAGRHEQRFYEFFNPVSEIAQKLIFLRPAPTLADDLRALFQNNQYAFAVCESGLAEWIDEQLRDILRKHGEGTS